MPRHQLAAAAAPIALDERWAPIPTAPGYEASTYGRIRSVDRTIVRTDGRVQRRPGRLLRLTSHGKYLSVGVGGKFRYVHALVLEAFVGPAPEGMECLHGTGGPRDNRLSNLRWGTRLQNMHEMFEANGHPMSIRTHCPQNHLLQEPNLVRHVLKRGGRNCLACNRGRARIQYLAKRGVTASMQEVSDRYYAEIMKEVA